MRPPITFEHYGPLDDTVITMDYSQPAVRVIQALPKAARTFDAASRTWRVHPAWAEPLAASLRRIGFEVIAVNLDRTA